MDIKSIEKNYGGVNMKLGITECVEKHDEYIAISHIWRDIEGSNYGQFLGRNVSSKGKALALSQIS